MPVATCLPRPVKYPARGRGEAQHALRFGNILQAHPVRCLPRCEPCESAMRSWDDGGARRAGIMEVMWATV